MHRIIATNPVTLQLVLLLALPIASTSAALPTRLVDTNFETSLDATGWKAAGPNGKVATLKVVAPRETPGSSVLEVRDGWAISPRFNVEPLRYYQADFDYRSEAAAMYSLQYFDAAGEPLAADNYNAVDPTIAWRTERICFRTPANAAAAELRLEPQDHPLVADNIVIRLASVADVAAWIAEIAKQIPDPKLPSDLAKPNHLDRTFAKLKRGEPLRIVGLGDSIINDTSNSNFEVLLQAHYPGSQITLIPSLRGGTGCPWYREAGRVKSYVLDHQPDLVIIGGISHLFDAEAIGDVVRQIRASGQTTDILILTGAICPWQRIVDHRVQQGQSTQQVATTNQAFLTGLQQIAREHKTGFLDFHPLWEDYVAKSGRPTEYFQRDVTHGNARGKVAAGKMLADYFRLAEK